MSSLYSYAFWCASALVCSGIFLFFRQQKSRQPRLKLVSGILLTSGIAIILLLPAKSRIDWLPYDEGVLQRNVAEKQPVLLYFAASWCYPCYELDQFVFSRSDVADELETFIKLKIDLSDRDDTSVQMLIDEYDVASIPVMDFYLNGQRRRISGYVQPEELLKRIRGMQSGKEVV